MKQISLQLFMRFLLASQIPTNTFTILNISTDYFVRKKITVIKA